jgi:hypothetical protein
VLEHVNKARENTVSPNMPCVYTYMTASGIWDTGLPSSVLIADGSTHRKRRGRDVASRRNPSVAIAMYVAGLMCPCRFRSVAMDGLVLANIVGASYK